MRTDGLTLAYDYLRLSDEECAGTESTSIASQRMIIENYCRQNGITLVREFSDDGWSGGNFDRPGFKNMLGELEKGKVKLVITKDLSRLGRDMRESSYYAEQYFPERGIRYVAIGDNFDSEHDNIMAPFLFAMNEVYLRDGSRKVKDVLRSKRENGQYCACPPYGYRKSAGDKHRLAPDEMTAPVVQRIFKQAANGDSSRTIAMDLNNDGIIPPLKYRVLFRDEFSEEGASHASDAWNYTTVKRILRNPVYLGHTLLGKSRRASIKSNKKVPVPREAWSVTENTHPPLVSKETFELAQINLGQGAKNYKAYSHIRKSIFSGIAVCGRCGGALCSAGTVYKGEREKYWYLACTHMRQDIADPCEGVRVRYADLLEVVRQDLNSLLAMDEDQVSALVDEVVKRCGEKKNDRSLQLQREKAGARLATIDKVVAKLYVDNAEGRLDDARLQKLVGDFESESKSLKDLLDVLDREAAEDRIRKDYGRFFSMARRYANLETLDRSTLVTFVERIEIGPKEYPEGVVKATRKETPYRQKIRIVYRFIGDLSVEPIRDLPVVEPDRVSISNSDAPEREENAC